MKAHGGRALFGSALVVVLVLAWLGCQGMQASKPGKAPAATTTAAPAAPQAQAPARGAADEAVASGRQIFRYDTFGDEAFWGGSLRLHEAIAGSAGGGVGGGISPKTALSVGL